MEKLNKEFFATSWAIDNKISVYVLVFIIYGVWYNKL